MPLLQLHNSEMAGILSEMEASVEAYRVRSKQKKLAVKEMMSYSMTYLSDNSKIMIGDVSRVARQRYLGCGK